MVQRTHRDHAEKDFAIVLPARGGVDNQSPPPISLGHSSPRSVQHQAGRTSGVCFCPYDNASTLGAVHRLSERLQACPQCLLSQPSVRQRRTLEPHVPGAARREQRGPGGTSYALSEVRVYSGRPDPKMDIRTFNAHQKQSQSWRLTGATVIERELRYPQGRPQEKDIDVALAVDFVRLAIQGAYTTSA